MTNQKQPNFDTHPDNRPLKPLWPGVVSRDLHVPYDRAEIANNLERAFAEIFPETESQRRSS